MKDVIKQIKKIDVFTKKLVNTLIAGNYYSLFKGQGIEFSEIREYKPNDDVRSIDWNVTARYNKPFIKQFIEERNLRIYFLVDSSASNNFGATVEKKHKALELVASLIFSAVKNNDAVGLVLFTENVEMFVPARKGKKHALRLIKLMLTFEPKLKTTNISNSFSKIVNMIKKRSFMFVISDFFDDGYLKHLKMLKRKHDIVLVKVNDKRELEMPDVGLIQLEDEETGEQLLVDSSDETFRHQYAQFMKQQNEKFDKMLAKAKIDCLSITTDMDYAIALKKFFKIRGRK